MRFRKPVSFFRYLARALTAPIIFGLVIPLVLFDFCVEIYHRLCFPIYGLTLIERKKYIALDRHRLPYLTFWEKIFCDYCGYANGLLAYVSAIAAATEKYFCAIRHKKESEVYQPPHHKNFLRYGDAATLARKYPRLRASSKKAAPIKKR